MKDLMRKIGALKAASIHGKQKARVNGNRAIDFFQKGEVTVACATRMLPQRGLDIPGTANTSINYENCPTWRDKLCPRIAGTARSGQKMARAIGVLRSDEWASERHPEDYEDLDPGWALVVHGKSD